MALARRLAAVPFTTIVTSPLERTRETAEHIHAQQERTASDVVVDERFIECDYGKWTGQSLATLAKKPLWKQVHDHCGYRLEYCDTDADMLRRAHSLLREAGVAEAEIEGLSR